MKLGPKRSSLQVEMAHHACLIEQAPGSSPIDIGDRGAPPPNFATPTRLEIERLGAAVGMEVRCSIYSRPGIDHERVRQVVIDVIECQRPYVHSSGSLQHGTTLCGQAIRQHP